LTLNSELYLYLHLEKNAYVHKKQTDIKKPPEISQ